MRPGDFIAAVREEFPELDSVIKEDEGLFYLQVGSLVSYTQGAIDDGDSREVQRQFEFMRRAWLAGDNEVQNALGVAYLEHLNFQDGKQSRSWAWGLLPEPLKSNARSLGVAPAE